MTLTRKQATDIGGATSGDREITREEWQQRHGKGFSDQVVSAPKLKQASQPITFEEFQGNIRREFIPGSAITPKLFATAIDFIEDTGYWEPNEAL